MKYMANLCEAKVIKGQRALAWECRGDEWADNPEKAFSGNGKKHKNQARIAEHERMLGQLS